MAKMLLTRRLGLMICCTASGILLAERDPTLLTKTEMMQERDLR